MIVTSKRCFLNVLTQVCDANTLLNAAYYIADIQTPDGTVQLSDRVGYNQDGQLEINSGFTEANPPSAITRYNIAYGSELNPVPYIAEVLNGTDAIDDPRERFRHHLNTIDTLIATYTLLFKNEPKGNGLQIVIFSDDMIVREYVGMICEYLAYNFGCDISFIDPMYRPNVMGKPNYTGNKAFAIQNIKDIRDAQLIINFNAAITNSCGGANANNLQMYLSPFNVQQLIYLYNLLWPEEPLPPDNYNSEHMRNIIVGKVSSAIPTNPWDNIASTLDFMSMIKDYESEDYDITDVGMF